MAASFGDIVPNHIVVRGIVILHLFVNFMLLGILTPHHHEHDYRAGG
jgi:hypothetical protein